MRHTSMASTMASLRRSGSRLFRMTTKLLKQATVNPKPAKPAKIRKVKAKPAPPEPRAPSFAPNPGHLLMNTHVPKTIRPKAPLVVLLHGCGQDANAFAAETGWRRLADKEGFVLLMPGQTSANNRQGCFNWFRPADIGRDLGEAGSIAAMVHATIKAQRCDPSRVFVTGLSAGAAMTACLLASYPDLFAGGAIVAGLPAGAASGVVGAMTRMSGHGAELPAEEWMGRARGLAPIGYTGPWPSVSIWQGDADHVVAPVNATHLAQQWCTLEGPFSPPITETVRPGIIRERWSRLGEAPRIESWRIAGMGHIYPTQANGGIAASTEIAGFWGISRR